MLVVSLVSSLIFVCIVLSIYSSGSRSNYRIACLVVIAGLFCVGSIPVLLNVFLVAVATFICGQNGVGPRAFRWSVIGCTLASYLVASALVIGDLQRAAERKARYPLESMVEKLGNENRQAVSKLDDSAAIERLV